MVDFVEYQTRTADTAIYPGQGQIMGLAYVGLGLGESGEVQGKIKKVLRDDGGVISDEKRAAIAKELGDMLWYVSQTATELGLSLEQVAADNLAKLASRQERGVIGGDGDER
ncbi:MAG: nucleoside triphosphate pyrophosphohydrolase family protein [Hydrogenophaga sp.]|uniref:nucleoside triphosphate pyrophosphohydrolase family protein n=1 Tax=Hydrogenophaga sp. TaxID=1904254 RepID=UPI0026098D2E|nr:nucleoside triphosphate pyrophosphohydrolase family protein [Hydrogenophaga sp.]MCV0439795.1 nucleoside triphosphate pyrophosphohydrolase family protein [Hydrogenophaga sp.]